ncbi:MAG: PAS domain S-box protein [Halobacteriota archaeon]|nr:PAS domain S-box protein [Halobacteriota archaeon]
MNKIPLNALIVEDSEDDTELILLELKKGGFEPEWDVVWTSEGMVDALKRREWDVVISDYKLPQFSGPEALKISKDWNYDTPFILVSGKIGEETAVEVIKSGANDFINKEHLARLVMAVKRELSDAETRRERREAEKALQDSESKWRSLTENSPDVIMTVDNNGTIQFINRTVKEVSGNAYVIGSSIYRYVSPEEVDMVRGAIERVINTGVPEIYRTSACITEGRVVGWYEVHVGPVFDGKTIVGATLSARDITEKKLAEEKIRAERNRAQMYLDVAGVMFVVINKDEEVTLVNNKGCQILGYSEEEITGKNWFDNFIPDNINDEVRSVFKKLIAEEIEPVENYENTILTKSGEERIIAWHNTILRGEEGNAIGTLSSGEDITERKKAEEALRESEERFRQFFEYEPEFCYMISSDGIILDANNSALNALDYKKEEIVGRPLDTIYPLQSKEMLRNLFDRWKNGKEIKDEEIVIHSKKGKKYTVLLSATAVKDKYGKILNFVSVQKDITERKRAEEELKLHRDHLEDLVRERTKELEEVQEALIRKERLAVLGQLAGGVGHELRNPLGVISNAVYYLKTTLASGDETTKEYLDIISKMTLKMNKIISDLLGLSRVRPGDREEITIADLVDKALENDYPPKNLEASARISSGLPAAFVDPEQITSVLSNILNNAYQAMPDGGKLSINANALGNDRLAISISDTGCGISGGKIEKIFEPLYTTKGSGIGLGLSVSKNLAEINGGRIEVKSNEDKGCTFTLILPTKG